MSSTWSCVRRVFCKPETDFADVHHMVTTPFNSICEGNSFVKVATSNHILNRQMVNFILDFWSISSQEISKWFIYTYAAGAIGGHLNFKILLRKFIALVKNFFKITQSIPLELQKIPPEDGRKGMHLFPCHKLHEGLKITLYLTISKILTITTKQLEFVILWVNRCSRSTINTQNVYGRI